MEIFQYHNIILVAIFACLALWYGNTKRLGFLIFGFIGFGLLGMCWFPNGLELSKETMKMISIDCFSLAGFLFVFQMIKHLSYSDLLIPLFSIGLYFGLNQLDNQLALKAEQSGEPYHELIIQANSKEEYKQILLEYEKIITSTSIAFKPDSKDITELEEYFVWDVKDDLDFSAIIRDLNADKRIKWVEFNQKVEVPNWTFTNKIFTPNKETNDPLIAQQWMTKPFEITKVHQSILNSDAAKNEVLIAILDTGIDANHEDLRDRYLISDQAEDNFDKKGHGTHCAGIAAAVSNNKIGITSLIPENLNIQITSVKVLNNMGFGTQRRIINGIIKAADLGADVISLSLGGASSEPKEKAYADAVKYANDLGVIVIVAAGNSNKNAKYYSPANTKNVIAVAAVDENLNLASFSNWVDDLEYGVAGPGKDIFSTLPNNKYGNYSGTSMATPFVAGLVAIFKSFDKDMDTATAYKLLSEQGIGVQTNTKIVQPSKSLQQLLK